MTLTSGLKVPTTIKAKHQQNADTMPEEIPLDLLGHNSAIKSHGSGAAMCGNGKRKNVTKTHLVLLL